MEGRKAAFTCSLRPSIFAMGRSAIKFRIVMFVTGKCYCKTQVFQHLYRIHFPITAQCFRVCVPGSY